MIRIYWFFCKRFIQVAALIFVMSLLGSIGLHIFGVEYRTSIMLVGTLTIYATMFIPTMFLSKAGWLTLIPIKRWKLPVIAFFLNVTFLILTTLVACGLAITVSYVNDRTLGLARECLAVVQRIFSSSNSSADLRDISYITLVINYFVFVWSFFSVGFSNLSKVGPAIGRPSFALANQRKPNSTRGISIVLAIMGFLYLLSPYLLSGFGLSLFITGTGPICVYAACRKLAVFGPTRKSWFSFALTVMAFELGFILISAVQSYQSPDAQREADAISFLGPWAHPDKDKIASLLYSDLSSGLINRLKESYKFDYEKSKNLDFEKVIHSKTRPEAVLAALYLFDSKALSSTQIVSLYQRLEELAPETNPQLFNHHMIRSSPTSSEVLTYLDSKNFYLARFGVFYARFHPDEKYISKIWENIARYPDVARMSALRTLSVITGFPTGIDEYVRFKENSKIPHSDALSPDCASFRLKRLSDFTATDAPALNFCVRKLNQDATNMKWIESMENNGIITYPLNSTSKYLLRSGLRLKDEQSRD